MELGCGIFLSNLSLVIASFSQAFIQTTEYAYTIHKVQKISENRYNVHF